MQGINLNEYIALNDSNINYSPSAQTKDFYKRLSANKQSSNNDPSSSLGMKQINSQNGTTDHHNNAVISVNSEHLQSKLSEENTFTIKMSDANEKEKRLLRKLEQA